MLDADNKAESVLIITADNFSVKGLKFKNVGISYTKEIAAVLLSKSNKFTVSDNFIENSFYGFIIQDCRYGLFQNNTVTGNAKNEASSGNGFHVWKSKRLE